MFAIDNKDVIELAAIRQKFLCMGQSVSLAYESLTKEIMNKDKEKQRNDFSR